MLHLIATALLFLLLLVSPAVAQPALNFVPATALPSQNDTPAKELFGRVKGSAALAPEAIGFYSLGCLAGAHALASDGRYWQAMRPSRNRKWGHPELIRFIERFAPAVASASGWPGILVGDLAQPRGGPMLTGHASHQVGLDADIWFKPMPLHRMTNTERETASSITVVRTDRLDIDPAAWTSAHQTVLRTAATDSQVQRIFVNPAIKRALCRNAKGDSWLSKIRPEQGHDYHFHVRLLCLDGASKCSPQDPTPEGDGCDETLEAWFTEEALHSKFPPPPTTPLTLVKLPPECKAVLDASDASTR